ncbi:putative toxin-antitoxin system toxin component, PIN family [Mesoaciditoga lauensis]|uniref:putative toxin-antitoxin system toxin component, PIN family n=1 Tax=Mesoaciditoga lauensis TaxID=1495039 RepID=UPI00055E4268|nr:putative toxin-antitoxin system toxin component, PIN family [Mesoaciditoga lauensis]
MKIVIDTNVVISAALGSNTCKYAILKAFNGKHDVVEPKIISLELERFVEKIKGKGSFPKEKIDDIDNFFKVFIALVKICEPKEIMSISPDKPDNFFLSLAAERSALFISGDKLALKIGKSAGIFVMSPKEWENFQKEY